MEARYEKKHRKVNLSNIMFRDNSLQEIELASNKEALDLDSPDEYDDCTYED